MTEKLQDRPARQFLRLFIRWLRAPDRGTARWMIVLLLVLTCAQVAVQIRFNLWNRDFFNALENRDSASFRNQILVFLVLAALSMTAAVYQLYIKQLIQLRWREWLTGHLLDGWLSDGRQYKLELMDSEADNPDQRIAEDVRIATELAVEFVTGLLNSLLMFGAFVGILWSLSGPLHATLMGREFTIPGYMVWAALLYACLGTLATWLVGRPMVKLNVERTTREADFRFALVRARESGEGIAFVGGEDDERGVLKSGFTKVRQSVQALMKSQRNLMWLTSAYGTLAMIFPTIVASPGYFAGVITLGGLMQIGAAFGQVQAALNWFVDNVARIAEWRGAVERLAVFEGAVEQLSGLAADPEQPTITIVEGDGSVLAFRNLEVAFSSGTTVIGDATAEIQAGDRVLIKGESGTGKSTLFRAIGGLWPWGAGEIEVPPEGQARFLPQRPYLPLGSLRFALGYPAAAENFDDEAMREALTKVGLERLGDQLDEEARWDRTLSLGEQQRLAFARLLLHKPKWVFLDEATSALDEKNQDIMMELLVEELPDSAVISIGHRPGLERFHNRTLTLTRAENGARLVLPKRRRMVGASYRLPPVPRPRLLGAD
ncbi:ABC transporter ATP-binding protein/permease [Rhodovarius crocodyli]|uniref:ABC transporter ATP-binding protein/permease n=1 Tax=Rhodovarius crocodyli TaxID=1979269 RepID=A0A437M329_9PROT|nr:ABC transporter ATP-binding protein/permease [Rhodovarius crocodyli]RVT92032.1 ABC transporter ATP-binding protein/permease [Rhodovarius crocodyli]